MSRRYANPPITEVTCKFGFPDETKWDLATPGIIYSEVKERFPVRENRIKRLASAPNVKDSSDLKPEVKKRVFAVFLNQNRNRFIQTGIRSLVINQMKPYISWADCKDNIDYIFKISQKVIEFDALQYIGLCYVNIITIPGVPVDLERYFEIRPFLGKNLPQTHVSFITGCVFPFADNRDACGVRLMDTAAESDNSISFLLDIDYFLIKPKSIAADQTLDWVEAAHDQIENIFENSATESLKELFNEAK